MKNLNKKVMAIIIGNFGLLGSSVAQNVIGYPGITYPVQKEEKKEKIYKIDELMSSKIGNEQVKNKDDVSEMRIDALKEIASSLGASSGLAYRMNELKKETNQKAEELDNIFNFSKLTIDNGVLAPVLEEGLANYAQNSDDQVRTADKIYKITSQARFVSVYPTWRTYLRFSFPAFDAPNTAYLPKNETEKNIWDKSIKEGWEKGVMQANRIYESSYARLERDYMGMIKYKILLAEGLITQTIIAKQNLGVTGGGKEMSINDQIFRITDHSSLNPNNKDWEVEYPVTNQTNGKLK